MTHYNFYYCHSQQQRFQWFTCMSHYPVQKRLCPTANRRVHRTASRIKTCLLLKLWALRPPGLSDLAAQWIGEIAKAPGLLFSSRGVENVAPCWSGEKHATASLEVHILTLDRIPSSVGSSSSRVTSWTLGLVA